MDLVDQFKKNEEDFLKNCLVLDEDLDPKTDQKGLSNKSPQFETRAAQQYRSNTMRDVAACFKCKSATSKIKVWGGAHAWSFHYRCTGCGEKLKGDNK